MTLQDGSSVLLYGSWGEQLEIGQTYAFSQVQVVTSYPSLFILFDLLNGSNKQDKAMACKHISENPVKVSHL